MAYACAIAQLLRTRRCAGDRWRALRRRGVPRCCCRTPTALVAMALALACIEAVEDAAPLAL